MLEINKIYHGDCIKGMQQIESGGVDLILTDPPYGISYKTGMRKDDHKFTHVILNDSNLDIIEPYMYECFRILKENSAAYMFCSVKTLDSFMQIARKVGFTLKNVIIWNKGVGTKGDLEAQYQQCYEPLLYLNKGRKSINGKRISDIWFFPRVSADKLLHQNEKPIPLLEQCLVKSSQTNDLVFDGFMGSGSTAVACMKTNRRYIGFELDGYYFNVAQKRLRNEKQMPKDMFGYE